MAATKKRNEKTVLSRQEISSRKRQISEKKLQTDGVARRAILGVFVLAFSLLGLLALGSFDPKDRMGPGFENLIGPAGHLVAEALRGTFGICAYVLPLAGLYATMIIFVGRSRSRWQQGVSAVLLTLSSATLAHLAFEGDPGWAHPPGGQVGAVLASVLSGLFSTVGTVILVTAVCVTALIVGTQFVFLRLCSAAWTTGRALTQQGALAAAAFWKAQQQALAARREASAKSRLEEAAFLAQLEADEEALSEQEAEIAEAEEIAEEAERLSREAMKHREAEAARVAEEKKKKGKADRRPSRIETPAHLLAAGAPEGAGAGRGDEPAWVSSLAMPPRLEDPDGESKTARKAPTIVTATASSIPPVPAVTLERQVQPAASPEPTAPAPAAAALARLPKIIEPKAPPTPTARKQEQFEFVGDRRSFTLPPIDEVLSCDKSERSALDKEAFLATAEKLRAKLADFGIVGEVVEIRPGPVVTMYEFLPGPGIKVSKIASLADDLAMAMEAMRVRIVAPIPGKGVVGIEVPNRDRETVYLKEIAEQDAFLKSASRLTMCVGKDIEGMPYVLDLAKAPHMLIAGTTGSGKSVAVNAMIMSLLLKSTPEEVRFIMVDPKMLELSVYEGIPHLLLPVVTDPKKAALALRWAVEEMERRYALLAEAGVRNIAGYNKLVEAAAGAAKEQLDTVAAAPAMKNPEQKKPRKLMIIDVAAGESEEQALERASAGHLLGVAAPREEAEDVREAVVGQERYELDEEALAEAELEVQAARGIEEDAPQKKQAQKLPYIVVIIDELADLMMVASREVETYIARLAQMARASGIHLMVATQRPSTDVVTGVIKANFPTRITFMLRSKPDSMTILGTVGAESLLGMGDMLIMPPTSAHLQRVHGAFVSEPEIARVVQHLKAQGKPVYDDSILKPRDEESDGAPEEDVLSDELYDQALAVVADMRQVSISMLQRKMRIGYNRAARMIERMERDGVVGPADGARPREVFLRQVGEMPGAGAA
jgi:DNA segregation ATPase FtsK/SpoIIIE, S-DNA-T family